MTDVVDVTDKIQAEIKKEKFISCLVNLFIIGSTASLTTIEADENLFADLKAVLEKIIPYKKDWPSDSEGWQHHQTWGDDNGAAHLRASLLGPSLTIPIVNGKLFLGTWQQIVLIDFDTKIRLRKLIIFFIKT